MSMGTVLMSSEEMAALPDDDKFERWLIDGELRERPMSLRSPAHASAVSRITTYLSIWCWEQPRPWNQTYSGDIYFRLRRNPDTNVGVDVALARPEQVERLATLSRFIDGPPLLAVEVLSASDVMEYVHEKIGTYLDCGTLAVWVVDPFDKTITVYRPGVDPVMFSHSQELSGEPVLPGFRCRVAAIFE